MHAHAHTVKFTYTWTDRVQNMPGIPGSTCGDSAALKIWQFEWLEANISQSTCAPCATNILSVSFRTNVPVTSPLFLPCTYTPSCMESFETMSLHFDVSSAYTHGCVNTYLYIHGVPHSIRECSCLDVLAQPARSNCVFACFRLCACVCVCVRACVNRFCVCVYIHLFVCVCVYDVFV